MHSFRFPGLILVTSALLILGLGEAPQTSRSLDHDSKRSGVSTRSSVAPPIDTLYPTVDTGEPLILSLPSELDDSPVSQYSLIRGPSLSGVAHHSFTWMTDSVDPDTYEVMLQANHPETSPDTLLLQVEVQE